MKKWFGALGGLLFALCVQAQQSMQLYIGTYTGGLSKGIYQFAFDTTYGTAIESKVIEASNPSYIAMAPDGRSLYAVHENGGDNNGGQISAYRRNPQTGALEWINTLPTGGDHPCFVSVDPGGRWVAAGNYSGGNFSIFSVRDDGGLRQQQQLVQHQGHGADPERQEKPHVHCTAWSPNGQVLLVPDLGIDRVMLYQRDPFTGQVKPAAQTSYQADPGAGPRHIRFSPSGKFAYLIEELSGTVVAFKWGKNKLSRIQRISTLAPGDTAFAGSADVHVSPDGRYLYASNRADYNNIAIYRINQRKGTLTLLAHQSTLGKGPRHFAFDPSGKFMLVGNQNSDEVVIFRYHADTGLLTDTGNRIKVGKPVCFAWGN